MDISHAYTAIREKGISVHLLCLMPVRRPYVSRTLINTFHGNTHRIGMICTSDHLFHEPR